MKYIAIPFKGKTAEFDNSLKAQEHIKKQFPGNKIFTVPVAAFGVAYTMYIDNEKYEKYSDWSMGNPCGVIVYNLELDVLELVDRDRKQFKPEKVL